MYMMCKELKPRERNRGEGTYLIFGSLNCTYYHGVIMFKSAEAGSIQLGQ